MINLDLWLNTYKLKCAILLWLPEYFSFTETESGKHNAVKYACFINVSIEDPLYYSIHSIETILKIIKYAKRQ